ncbi:MAG: hypothetical protein WDZ74_02455 [Candidatus Paceibacterota bacterium]
MQLVINPGSASKKYSLYEDGVALLSARFEKTHEGFESTLTHESALQHEQISEEEYFSSLEKMLFWCRDLGLIKEHEQISVVGVRIVASGSFFMEHRLIDDGYVNALRDACPYAPLHITSTLQEIEKVQELLPETPVFGISDSEFHKTLPPEARTYAINPQDAEDYDVWRFGYHGLSVESVLKKAETLLGESRRTIVCHLGGGMSITAVLDGKSIETSMGFAPASGLPMSARVGDMDAEALLTLMQRKNLSPEEARLYVSTQAGYKALTGGVGDMRDLLHLYELGDEKALLAIHILQHSIKKFIGSYVAILGGLDSLILTATTNERNAPARQLFFGNLEYLGIVIDEEKNKLLEESVDGLISSEQGVKIAVISTDEMGNIATIAQSLYLSARQGL